MYQTCSKCNIPTLFDHLKPVKHTKIALKCIFLLHLNVTFCHFSPAQSQISSCTLGHSSLHMHIGWTTVWEVNICSSQSIQSIVKTNRYHPISYVMINFILHLNSLVMQSMCV